MDPIFETDFAPETTAITVAGADVPVLGALDGKCLVTCDHAVGTAHAWRRRWDLEEARREQYEQMGAQLAEQMAEADAMAAAKVAADAQRVADEAAAELRRAEAAERDAEIFRLKAEAEAAAAQSQGAEDKKPKGGKK